MKDKVKIKKAISEANIEEARAVVELAKKRIKTLEEASIDQEKLKKIIDGAVAFEKRNSGRKFKSDIIVSLFGKEHVFVVSFEVTNIFFDGDEYEYEYEYDIEYTIRSKKKSFLDREIEMNISAALDEGLDCDDFRKTLVKEVPEFAAMVKELNAIDDVIYALSEKEKEIVMEKI